MAYDLNDPGLDFDIEQEALLDALKNARGDKQAVAPSARMMGEWVMSQGPMGGVGAALTRGAGALNEQSAMGSQRALGGEEKRRADALQQQLATSLPMTRKRMETVDGGTAMDGSQLPSTQQEVDEPIPEEEYAVSENQRRMGIAQQMSKLPMTRAMGEKLWATGVNFPEKLQEIKMRQAAAKEAAAAKALADAKQNEMTNEIRLMGARTAQQNADTASGRAAQDAAEAQLKREGKAMEENEKRSATIDFVDSTLSAMDEALGTRDDAGNLIPGKKPVHSGFSDFVGFTYLPYAKNIDGTDAATYRTLHDQIAGSGRLQGVQMMKGAGQVSNAEGAAAKDAINRMSGSMKEKDYIKAATDYRKLLNKIRDRAARGMKITPDGREYADTGGGGAAPAQGASPQGGAAPAQGAAPETRVLNNRTYVKIGRQWYEQ